MAIIGQYTKPGVYTSVVYEDGGISLFSNTRIPALVAEGQETQKLLAQELHRGSSSTADEQKVLEDLSDQVAAGRSYQLAYAPVVKGDGKGVITNDPGAIQAYTLNADGEAIPLRVTTLDGTTGKFMLQDILALKSSLKVSYFFKRKDTQILAESTTSQIPTFATMLVQSGLTLSTSLPGFVGNYVHLALTLAAVGAGAVDALAVTGAGTDLLSIELRKPDDSVRTLTELKSLIEAGIPTHSAGILTISAFNAAHALDTVLAKTSTAFINGLGQNTNKVFKTANAPIVDGSDGGVVTNDPKKVQVTVNSVPVTVYALEGNLGLFTLLAGVLPGDDVRVTYFINTYQDTFDELPAANVQTISAVGYAPGREDFVNGVDFVLKNNQIHWGASAILEQGKYTPGYTPFDASVVTATLADEKMYLRPVTGAVNGVNTLYEIEDVPTDGSGQSRPTDNPALIQVYVGLDPVQALAAGPVRVVRLVGRDRKVTLFNPPAIGEAVFATYYRNTLNDHAFTLKVTTPGSVGQGAYSITDELGSALPVLSEGNHSVTDADFVVSGGIIWPFSSKDARCVGGQTPNEVITLTFQDDNLSTLLAPAVQATNLTAQAGLRFRATLTGVGPNGPAAGSPTVRMIAAAPCADAAAIAVAGEDITINVNREDPANPGDPHPTHPTRTLGDVADQITSSNVTTIKLGKLLCEVMVGVDPLTLCLSGAATYFSGGTAQRVAHYATRYKVSSSRTRTEAMADALGMTGGATTNNLVAPAFGADTPGAVGFLGQTFNDLDTGFVVTIVDPNEALDYGYTSLPSPGYRFQPGDKLVFQVNDSFAHTTSAVPSLSMYGLRVKVGNTFGMYQGDSLVINTFNKAGNEPAIGEYYFADLLLGKSESDYAIKYFTNLSDVYKQFGDPLPENRASLAAKLMFQNGASIVAIKQVQKQFGLETASDQAYMEAISELAVALPGSDRRPDVIVPMTTSPVVLQYLAKFLNIQASSRQLAEAMGFVGLPLYATSGSARSLARSISSERVIMAYPGGAILSVDINGRSTEFTVDGSFLAAAMCGLYLNPANDVATTLTFQKLVGFDRLIKRETDPIMDLMASDGVCILTELDGALEIRHYKTTSTDNILKQEPTTTSICDMTRQLCRKDLKQFVGRKNVQAVCTDIAITMNSRLGALISQEILESYKNLAVSRDKNDPTVINVVVTIKPVFSVLWINIQFSVTTRG